MDTHLQLLGKQITSEAPKFDGSKNTNDFTGEKQIKETVEWGQVGLHLSRDN
jgi:hypothetical protein